MPPADAAAGVTPQALHAWITAALAAQAAIAWLFWRGRTTPTEAALPQTQARAGAWQG